MRLIGSVSVAALGCALVLGAGFASAADVAGTYDVNGTNFDGSRYGGTAEIRQTSEHTCRIAWTTGSTTSEGFCMMQGNTVAVSYNFSTGEIGMVIYQVRSGGVLEGTWTIADRNGVGTEVLTPQ